MTYFITFSCYGARLHGNPGGSVDSTHNIANTPLLPPAEWRRSLEEQRMHGPAFVMNPEQREIALNAIEQVCVAKEWTLLAAHVRKTHVHIVVAAGIAPERLLNGMKTAISRVLNRRDSETKAKRWSRHGSTRYLWTGRQIHDAIRYVAEKQGAPMAVYVRGWER